MNDKLSGRRLYVPLGRKPLEDLNLLADAIAGSDADLFNQDECLIWITAGKRVPVNPDVLREIIKTHIAIKQPVNRGIVWAVEYRPVEPDEMTLRTLLTAKTLKEGSLVLRVPKTPSEPVRLTQQQQREVRDRLKIGEPKDKLAREYNVDVDTIRQLAS